jgi:hypothetical protein
MVWVKWVRLKSITLVWCGTKLTMILLTRGLTTIGSRALSFVINYYMSSEKDELSRAIQLVMYDVMLVLYKHGYNEVNAGGLMRVLGVSSETASLHDEEILELTKEFAKYVKELKETRRPDDETLH